VYGGSYKTIGGRFFHQRAAGNGDFIRPQASREPSRGEPGRQQFSQVGGIQRQRYGPKGRDGVGGIAGECGGRIEAEDFEWEVANVRRCCVLDRAGGFHAHDLDHVGQRGCWCCGRRRGRCIGGIGVVFDLKRGYP